MTRITSDMSPYASFSSPTAHFDTDDPFLALAALRLRQEHESRRTDEQTMREARLAMIAAGEKAIEHMLEKARDIRTGAFVSLAVSTAAAGLQTYGLSTEVEGTASALESADLKRAARQHLACSDDLAQMGNLEAASVAKQMSVEAADAAVTADVLAARLTAEGALWRAIGAGISRATVVGDKVIGEAGATREDAKTRAAQMRADAAQSLTETLKEDGRKSEKIVEKELDAVQNILTTRHQMNIGIIGRI